MPKVLKFSFSLIPPSVNSQKAAVLVNGRARLIKTKPYRDWINFSLKELQFQRGFGETDFIWRSDILFPCNASKMDIDNAPKALHDILVMAGKVPDDRHLADCRIRWATGDKIIVAIQQEELNKWLQIKKMSKSLTRKLEKFSPLMSGLW